VRIDIFIRKGEPAAVAVNEISLSSGIPYFFHFEWISKLWADGHAQATTFARRGATPIYEHSALDAAAAMPNKAAVLSGLRELWAASLQSGRSNSSYLYGQSCPRA